MRIHTLALVGLWLVLIGCALGEIIKDFTPENEAEKDCTGSIKILDKDEKELIVVSSKHNPEERLIYDGKSKGGKAILDGNCCFEVRQKSVGKGGRTAYFTENKEYSVSFPVKYVIKSECPPDQSSTALVPILIAVAVLAVLAIVAVGFYVRKRRGMTQLNQTE